MATFVKILGYSKDSKNFNNIACDTSGNLVISGLKFNQDGELLVTGSGGGGGDASSANQEIQIEVAQNSNIALYQQLETQTDRILYDTDIIANNISDSNVAVCERLDNMVFTSGNLMVRDDTVLAELQGSNVAQYSKLAIIANAAEDTLLSVDGINTKLNSLQLQSAKYTIEAAPFLAPDTTPAYTAPPSTIPKSEGWYFKNTGASQPSQLYYYSYTNPALQVPARQFAYQLNDISIGYCVVRLLSVNATAGLPTMAIYTRPTGSGDAFPGYYKSKKVYSIPSTAKITQGMKLMLWWGSVAPSLKLHPDVARIQLDLVSTTGPALGTEQLAFLSIQTDSTALAGNSEYIVSAAGFQYAEELIMDSTFTGESSATVAGGDASAANQEASNTAVCARLDASNVVLTNINTNLDQLTYTGSNLQVHDAKLSGELSSLNSTIGQGVYINMETTPPVSGGIKLSGSNDGNLFVYDAQCNSTIQTVYTELFALNDAVSSVISGDQQLWVRVDALNDDSVGIYGYSPSLSMPEAIHTVDNSAKVYINNVVDSLILGKNQLDNNVYLKCNADQKLQVEVDKLSFYADGYGDYDLRTQVTNQIGVSVNNQPTVSLAAGSEVSLSAGTTVGLASGSSVALAAGSEVSLSAGATVGLSVGTAVSVNNFPTKQSVFVENTAEGFDLNVNVTNTSIPVSVSGTVPISSGSPLDTHLYAEHNSTWQSVKAAASGHLLVNSVLESDANGALTSTITDEINALDVAVQNIVSANLRTSVGGLLTSTSGGTTNSLDVAIKAGSELKTTDYGALTSTLSGTGNSVHSLDVAVKNSVSVQNTNSTPIVVAPRTAVWTQVATNVPSVAGNTQIGSTIDTDGYTYIWAYITIGTVTSGGNIYCEFSPDGITWIRTYYSTYVNSGTNITANISIGNSVPLKYYRLYTDSSVFLATVNAYFAMK